MESAGANRRRKQIQSGGPGAAFIKSLHKVDIFHGLSDAQLAKIARLCRVTDYPPGATVFAEGAEANALWLVGKGRVALRMEVNLGRAAAARHATVDALGEGEGFGWSALVAPHMLTMSAVCLEPCRLIRVDAKRLRHLMSRDPYLGHVVMCHICEIVSSRLREARQALAHSVAIAAHDLMTPLIAVETYLMVIYEGFAGEVSKKQQTMLERCRHRLDEVLLLTRNLLDSSRIETEELDQEFATVGIRDVVASCLKEAHPLATEKGVQLELVAKGQLLEVTGLARSLKQLFDRLLDNAIKFTPSGGRVTVRLHEDEGHVQAEVIDTGVGIARDDIPRVFDDYFRGRDVSAVGAGLGLAIARKIVQTHGGRIWAESPCGEGLAGSRFVVLLPK